MNLPKDAKVIHAGRFISLLERDGWEFVKRSNCTDIVIIIAVTNNNEFILIEQFRPPVFNRVIEFPAGLVNDREDHPEETILDAAKRELIEETGYLARALRPVFQGPVSSGSSADHVVFVIAEGLTRVHDGGGDSSEDITSYHVPFVKINQWLREKEREGFMVEPKVFTGLYLWNIYNEDSSFFSLPEK